jgi:cytochrome c5
MSAALRAVRVFLWMLAAITSVSGGWFVMALAAHTAGQRAAKPDASASRAAFGQVYKVLMSPRCANCHPAGEAPLQGDDSHVHMQNVKRGPDGHGVTAMRCDTCHQDRNLPGANLPPGSP